MIWQFSYEIAVSHQPVPVFNHFKISLNQFEISQSPSTLVQLFPSWEITISNKFICQTIRQNYTDLSRFGDWVTTGTTNITFATKSKQHI